MYMYKNFKNSANIGTVNLTICDKKVKTARQNGLYSTKETN